MDKKLQNNHSIPEFGIGLVAATAAITVSLFIGGAAADLGAAQLAIIGIMLVSGFGLLARGGMRNLDLPWQVLAFIFAMIALPLLQLIPLPPEIWRSLPGRAAETAIIDLAGGGNDARPLALNPNTNLQLFASLIALTAFSVIVARLSNANIVRLLRIVLSIALVQFLIGAVQFTTAGGALDFFGNSHKGWLLGTFANRNHAALFFASCILITAALYDGKLSREKSPSNKLERVILVAVMLLWLLAAVGTGSRTGLVLALVALAIASVVVLRGTKLPAWAWVSGATISAAGIAAVMTSSRMQRLVERYDIVGDDQRWSIWTNSVKIIVDYMPWGSGFGSFMAVYNKVEPLNELIPTYVNNAHNDYLELLIEAGLPGAIVLVAFLTMVVALVVRGVRFGSPRISRYCLVGGGIVFLFACHSVVDYPTRRMATAAVLFFGLGLLLRQFNRSEANTQ
jgi:O-antigen ligase